MNVETLNEIRLPRSPESAARARNEIRRWLGEDHPGYEDARLVVSELVTNAVQHAGSLGAAEAGWLVLRLAAYGDLLRVEVADQGSDPRAPRIRSDPEGDPAENGRGLAIVEAISGGRWGCRSHVPGPGRTVWCEIPAVPPAAEEPVRDGAGDLPESSFRCASVPFVRPECGGLATWVWWLPPSPGTAPG